MSQGFTGSVDFITERVVALVDAAAVATDASQGSVFTLTTTQNFTLSDPTNPTNGQKATWRIKQDGTGGRVITLGAAFRVATDINSGSIVLSTGAGVTDYLGAIYNADDAKWDIIAFTKGIS